MAYVAMFYNVLMHGNPKLTVLQHLPILVSQSVEAVDLWLNTIAME